MSSVQRILCLVLLIFSSISRAGIVAIEKPYYPTDFYQGLDTGLRDSALMNKLFEILSKSHVPGNGHDTVKEKCEPMDRDCYQQQVLGYSRARTIMFGEIHLVSTPDGYGVLDVYCEQLATNKDFKKSPPGPGQIPDPAVLNTEHTWPQSRFTTAFNTEMQKSDLNILYPVKSNANSSRSNLKFGDVTDVTSQPCTASKRGHMASGRDSYFEVPPAHKGNAARSVFYYSVRYKTPITPDEEASLRAWHQADPPDAFEQERNELVYKHQRERNPFIDHPELVDLIKDF